MSWAQHAIDRLKRGETVTIKPHGNSMRPLVNDGDTVTISPITTAPSVGDIVLVRCRGRDYLHLIKAVRDNQYMIGNNRGGTNGWVHRQSIYGVKSAE